MSIEAILATFELNKKFLNSSETLLLLCLARRADDDHKCWPSIQCMVDDTRLDQKTIVTARKSLIHKSFIRYTGRLVGRSGQIPEMKLLYVEPSQNVPSKPVDNSSIYPVDKSVDNFMTGSENGSGTLPKNGSGTGSENGSGNRSLERISRKKSFCAHAPKNQNPKPKKTKAQWREENAKRPAWADKKDIAAASKVQMDREAEHSAQNEVWKRSPAGSELDGWVKKMESELAVN